MKKKRKNIVLLYCRVLKPLLTYQLVILVLEQLICFIFFYNNNSNQKKNKTKPTKPFCIIRDSDHCSANNAVFVRNRKWSFCLEANKLSFIRWHVCVNRSVFYSVVLRRLCVSLFSSSSSSSSRLLSECALRILSASVMCVCAHIYIALDMMIKW